MPMELDYRSTEEVEETRCMRNGKGYCKRGDDGKLHWHEHQCSCGTKNWCGLGSARARSDRLKKARP